MWSGELGLVGVGAELLAARTVTLDAMHTRYDIHTVPHRGVHRAFRHDRRQG